jgi:pimeloyl-ACP methyl ester carboxylesterase
LEIAICVTRFKLAMRIDPLPFVGEICGADLLLCGKQDAPIQFGNSFDCIKAVPRVTLTSLPRTGHLPREEAPAQAATSVLGLLPDRRSRDLIRRKPNPFCY